MRAALAGRAGQSISHLHPLGILALTSMILVHTGVGLREIGDASPSIRP